jgi:hypothetical protein
MSLKTFIFGRPSRQREIEVGWKESLIRLRAKYNPKIDALEKVKMTEIGFPTENAPKSIDEKISRLESLDAKIDAIQNELDSEEDRLWFKMMEDIKNDQIESSTIFGRMWLWFYWHV